MAEKSGTSAGVLGDISVSQILATALAAATSFALSSQIGVAGSIIGAVVGAVASTVATQLYRNLLSRSAEKIRGLGEDAADQTRAVGSVSGRARVEEVAASGTPIAPPEVRDAAHERAQARLRRRVALVALGVGVAAVLASALVVSLATQGAGIGTKPQASTPAVEEQGADSSAGQGSSDTQPAEPEAEPSGTTDDGDAQQGDSADDATQAPTTPSEDDASSPTDDASDAQGDATSPDAGDSTTTTPPTTDDGAAPSDPGADAAPTS